MTKPLLYIDTNVYIDCAKNRNDYLRPLGEFAFQLLRRIGGCEFDVVISDLLIKELEKILSVDEIFEMLNKYDQLKKVHRVESSFADKEFARIISRERKTSYSDTLHSILARKAGAIVLVTRNSKDFFVLSDIMKIKLPESV